MRLELLIRERVMTMTPVNNLNNDTLFSGAFAACVSSQMVGCSLESLRQSGRMSVSGFAN